MLYFRISFVFFRVLLFLFYCCCFSCLFWFCFSFCYFGVCCRFANCKVFYKRQRHFRPSEDNLDLLWQLQCGSRLSHKQSTGIMWNDCRWQVQWVKHSYHLSLGPLPLAIVFLLPNNTWWKYIVLLWSSWWVVIFTSLDSLRTKNNHNFVVNHKISMAAFSSCFDS